MAIGSGVTSGTNRSVLYVNSSNQLAQQNNYFNWDPANHCFTIGSSYVASTSNGIAVIDSTTATTGSGNPSFYIYEAAKSGTIPANNYGIVPLICYLDDATTTLQQAMKQTVLWATATHASNNSKYVINLTNNTSNNDVFSIDGTGQVSFLKGYSTGKLYSSSGGAINSYALTTSQSTGKNPTGTANTAAELMMGMAGSITPVGTGTVLITICGNITNSSASDGWKYQIRHGTGTAPTNTAAATGTADGTDVSGALGTGTNRATMPFSISALVTGLTANTAYWIDMSLAAVTGGTATLANVNIIAIEL
jgi:hypothetical protein